MLDRPVGVASAIWPHGRWRFDFTGTGDHAGTTRMADRYDPMLTFAYTVLAANKEARLAGAHATMARVVVEPNATNAIPSLVRGWLDARAADTGDGRPAGRGGRQAGHRAGRPGRHRGGRRARVRSARGRLRHVARDAARRRCWATRRSCPPAPGTTPGVLSAHVPTAMLFVRNPTGVSHSPAEHATDADCEAGIDALAAVLRALS